MHEKVDNQLTSGETAGQTQYSVGSEESAQTKNPIVSENKLGGGIAALGKWKRHIALFLSGQAISMFGSAVVQFAVMWYLTLETKSASIVALYAIFAFVPQGILSLFGGTLADRVNRKLLIIIPDLLIAITTLILAIIMAYGRTDLWIIMLVVTVRSIGAGFQQPAVSALIPSIVPSEHLLRVNGINSTLQSIIGLAAPAAGGVIYGLNGIGATLWVDVVTAIIGVVLLTVIPLNASPVEREQESFLKELKEGVLYTARHDFLRWLLTVYAVVFILIVAPSFLVPLLVTEKFGESVTNLTLVEMSFHIGMILGGVLVATVLAKKHRMRLLLVSSVVFGFLAVFIAIANSVWIIFCLMLVTGLFVPLFSGPSITELQERTEAEYLGRVMSQVTIIFTLGMPFGMVIFGPLSEVFKVAQVIGYTGAVTIGFVLLAFFTTNTGRLSLTRKCSGGRK